MQTDLVLQQPRGVPTAAAELLLLFHGVGSNAEDLRPLGHTLAAHRPNAWVVSVRSPLASDFETGWQWFAVQGVTEQNRPQRVATAMPAFLKRVQAWQRETGVTAEHTTLVGFSQGAIMALESTQQDGQPLASRVVAIAGRFAQPPRRFPSATAVHLMHGELDRVMPVERAVDADHQLRSLGARSTLDRFAGLGHGIDAQVVNGIAIRMGPTAGAARWPSGIFRPWSVFRQARSHHASVAPTLTWLPRCAPMPRTPRPVDGGRGGWGRPRSAP